MGLSIDKVIMVGDDIVSDIGGAKQNNIFKNLWVQPAAGDAGGSLGATLGYWHGELKQKRKVSKSDSMQGSYLGPKFTQEEIEKELAAVEKEIKNFGISRIIYTDINRDGTLTRPNLEETFKFAQSQKGNNFIPVLVSGGVVTINDVVAVQKKTYDPRIEGLIIGKAIYDGRMPHDQIVRLTDFN